MDASPTIMYFGVSCYMQDTPQNYTQSAGNLLPVFIDIHNSHLGDEFELSCALDNFLGDNTNFILTLNCNVQPPTTNIFKNSWEGN
jgi:hypothetical protein